VVYRPHIWSTRHTKVSTLIDQTMKTWNEQLIHQVVDVDTTHSVLWTPLFPQVEDDHMVFKEKKMDIIQFMAHH